MLSIPVLLAKWLTKNTGFQVEIRDRVLEKDFTDIYHLCKPYTVTSMERMYALYRSVHYLIDNDIPGDLVECGVYKGGSSMLMAHILKGRKVNDRKIYLYDTFEGMTAPTEKDSKSDGTHQGTLNKWKNSQKNEINEWCYSPLEEVERNLRQVGLPNEQLQFVKGKVEDTIPNSFHNNIALLRLDTDWYESTLHELKHLYPLLAAKGVLIIDDYGSWEGAKLAVDEYFAQDKSILLNRIDYTGRIGVKP